MMKAAEPGIRERSRPLSFEHGDLQPQSEDFKRGIRATAEKDADCRQLALNPINRTDVLRMIKRRAEAAALPFSTCCPTFRATGITAYLENGGPSRTQAIAAARAPRTTKLYDRTLDEITLDKVERTAI